VSSEPFGKFSTLLDSSTAYKNFDSSRHDPFCRALNMELLQFYYSVPSDKGSLCKTLTQGEFSMSVIGIFRQFAGRGSGRQARRLCKVSQTQLRRRLWRTIINAR
jgi:hypothetical protein